MKSTQRDAIKLAQSYGLEVLGFEHTGKTHYKLSLKNKEGNTAFFVMANSCSDHRAAAKNHSLFRRFADGTFNPVKQRGQKQ